jgi:hypothetical protein
MLEKKLRIETAKLRNETTYSLLDLAQVDGGTPNQRLKALLNAA